MLFDFLKLVYHNLSFFIMLLFEIEIAKLLEPSDI